MTYTQSYNHTINAFDTPPIKGYLDKDGKPQEKIYEVVWAGDRVIENNGKLPAIGNTVDIYN